MRCNASARIRRQSPWVKSVGAERDVFPPTAQIVHHDGAIQRDVIDIVPRDAQARDVGPNMGLRFVNDVIEIRNSNASRQLASKNLEISTSRAVPDWLSLDKEPLKGVVMRIPTRDEIHPIANEQAVVEFYSR